MSHIGQIFQTINVPINDYKFNYIRFSLTLIKGLCLFKYLFTIQENLRVGDLGKDMGAIISLL